MPIKKSNSTSLMVVVVFFSYSFTQVLSMNSLGVSEYLSTEICTSRQKKFSLVTFVDSPGLVDGDMKYPFDVDDVILWLGGLF